MPLTYIGGVEGSGKTTYMTRELLYHYFSGGRVFAFPGYELKNDSGRVVSETLLPEQVPGLLRMPIYDWAVAIDEIQNFSNKHTWQNPLNDLLAYGAAAQRRKRRFGMIATGPLFGWLPPNMKDMFHVVITMQDRRWKCKDIPRGEQFIITYKDNRGMLTGTPGTTTRPRIFKGKGYRKYFDSYSVVDPDWQRRRIKFVKELVEIGPDGRVIEDIDHSDPATLNRYIEEYQQQNNGVESKVKSFLKELIDKNVPHMPRELVYQSFGAVNKAQKDAVGAALKKMGAVSRDRNRDFLFTGVSL